MFGKLLKHEFIATGRIMAIVYGIIAVLSAYILGSFYLGDASIDDGALLPSLSLILLFFVAMANVVLTIIVIMSNFQKSLYGEQGYLTFTLPVKSVSLLSAKILVSTFWYIAASLTVVVASFLFLGAVEQDLGEEGVTLIEMLLGLYDENMSIAVLIFQVAMVFVDFFFAALMFTLEVCFAITLSNTRLFQKHHVIFTLVFSGVAAWVTSKITSVINDLITFGLNYDMETDELELVVNESEMFLSYIDLLTPIVTFALTVAFFFGTNYLMKKKINLR